ncbi:hypothetical protein [Inhella proteolytica]|uniref:Protein TonB n=1 Tax=Inhella proteolytica TaxID=2795029 RepID=A0A931NHR8_9BURK|nr:hypothetical protein [Inhella proteolytica]MBH9576800.1 hypothetical protein [Inhella proteolytica]
MQFASKPHASSSRLSGLGFVIVLHLLMIWALANGLVQRIVKPAPHETEVTVVPQKELPKELPKPVVREFEPPKAPLPWMPPTEPFEVSAPQDKAISTNPAAEPPAPSGPTTGTTQAAAEPTLPATAPVAQSASMLCPQMGRPELPALGVEGLASFRVLGTVRNGRVVAVELTALRALSDRRAMRQLAQVLERTVRETYQCGSSNGQFTQDFDFRID